MSTTPILNLDEMNNAQSEPEVVVNAAIRALEVFGQLIVIAKNQNDPPGSFADGDAYALGTAPTGDWDGFTDFSIAFASGGGWINLVPREGWKLFNLDDSITYIYTDTGSPDPWAADVGTVDASIISYTPSGSPPFSPTPTDVADALDNLYELIVACCNAAVDAAAVTYTPGGSPLFSPAPSDVADALDDLYALIDALGGSIETTDAYDIDYAQSSSPQFESPEPANVGDALDSVFRILDIALDAVKQVGVPLSIPGKPAASTIYNIAIAFDLVLPRGAPHSVGYAGTAATATATFTVSKNGTQVGTIVFAAGASAPTFTFADGVTFKTGDYMTITAPSSQDATLANIGITFRAERTIY